MQDDRCPLRTWLAQMRARDIEIFALVVDLSDSCWVCVNPTLAVTNHRVLSPRGFPEFIGNLDILLCEKIAVVMLI